MTGRYEGHSLSIAKLVKILVSPAFEYDQRPELMAVVGRSFQMVRLQFFDVGRVEKPFPFDPLLRQNVLHQRPQLLLEPVLDGNAKAFLLAVENLLWELAGHAPLEQVFALKTVQFQMAWHSGRELHDPVIEKGCSGFQRICHAHSVDLSQNVIDEIRLDVGKLLALAHLLLCSHLDTPQNT